MFRFIREYFLHSTLHGFHFIAEDNYHWTERIFWIVCCALSWMGSALLIKSSWNNFQNNAISFVVETTYLDVDTRFPTISVCEEDYQMVRVYDVALKMYGPDHDCNLDEVLKEIAYFHGTSYYIKEFCFDENILCPQDNYAEIAKQIRTTCDEMFGLCEWGGKRFNCCEHFRPIETEFGICYTLSPKYEERKPKNDSLNMISNSKYGLASLYLELKVMAKIYMHSESDIPYYNTLTTDILDAPPNIKKKFTISVTAIENENEVHHLSVKQRKCRFPSENYLQVTNEYSYSACITECRKNEQLRLCNCTSHLMPNTNSHLHCGIKGIICLNDHYANLAGPKTKWSMKTGLSCSCLPGCDEPEFNIVTTAGFGVESNLSKIEIVMDRLPSERYKRNVVRGRLDLVVSMGGATGLFVGASILSFIEIIYYFTFRLCHQQKQKVNINSNIINNNKNPNNVTKNTIKSFNPRNNRAGQVVQVRRIKVNPQQNHLTKMQQQQQYLSFYY
ncbi:sodium channel protein Nach-like [Lycorma delicatula]|uniref:sodium channel protein Nach-like n=1 Tax=Lycorma delicatula TaxID=130591 RepID=UPI003F510F40